MPGNFHAGVCYPPEKEAVAREIIHAVRRQAIEMDGTVTGEHGIGLMLRDELEEEVGENAIDMMRRVSARVCLES